MAEGMKTVVALNPVFYDIGGEQARGSRFEMREADVERHVKAGLVTVLGAGVGTATAGETSGDLPLEALTKKWTISTSPLDYLKRFPNGPNAALAMQILELEQEEKEAAEAAGASTGEPATADAPLITTKSVPQE